jgi:hypothetical protein
VGVGVGVLSAAHTAMLNCLKRRMRKVRHVM